MRKLLLLTAFSLWATPAFGQTATVSQTGDNQTASVTQTGSPSNEAYVTQLSDNTGPQNSEVLQSGISNFARVMMSQTGGGGIGLNTAFLRQIGDHNDMRQTIVAPGFNAGQHVWAEQRGDRNEGRQEINTGYTESLTLEQRGDRNDSRQFIDGGGHNHGEVMQVGDRNLARQSIVGSNFGYSSSEVVIDQRGDLNEAHQTATGGGSSMLNNVVATQTGNNNESRQTVGFGPDLSHPPTTNYAEVDQNGDANYARQDGTGGGLFLRVRQDGNANWARTNSVGDENYLNARMSHGAWLRATQTGDLNNLFGLAGAGTEARILNGSELTLVQTGDMNNAFVNMTTGGTGSISQIGSNNNSTVIQN